MQRTTILEFKLRLFVNALVSFDDRYGMNDYEPDASPLTTLPSAERLAFMCFASSSRTPVEVVRRTLSLPARSASTSLPYII